MRSRFHGLTLTHLISSDGTAGSGRFTPVTGWMPSGDWDSLRGRWYNPSTVDCEVRLAVRYSHDGINIDSPQNLTTFSSPSFSFSSVDATALPAGATEKLMIQIGFQLRRTNGGSVPMIVPILWQFWPAGKRATRTALAATTVATRKSSTTPLFFPVGEPFHAGSVVEVRGTLEVIVISGGEVGLGYWKSTDGITWSAPALVPGCSYQTTTGIAYANWTAIAPGADPLVQLGYIFRDLPSPTRVEFARVAGFVDMR